jgi:hypothetical protein
MLSFEPHITKAQRIYGSRMEALIETGKLGRYLELGRVDGQIREKSRKREAAFDAVKWSAFSAFDIIRDLVSDSR